jgi:hypothetical protein
MDKRSWILVGIIILMVGIMAGSGVWYLKGKKSPPKPIIAQNNPPENVQPPTEQGTSTPAETGTQTQTMTPENQQQP